MNKPQIGISACLLGEEVRFNGGHKKHHWITSVLQKHADFTSFCPEVGIGLPVPRPTLRLVQRNEAIIAVDSDTQSNDVTTALTEYASDNQSTLSDLDGFILMQGSPSCGMERVKVYKAQNSPPEKDGQGIFAKELMKNNPLLPVEEAGRLNDADFAESFYTRVFIYKDWKKTVVSQKASDLIAFHSRHKLVIMLHDYAGYRRAGKLLADLSSPEKIATNSQLYISEVMNSLAKTSSRGQRMNALLHIFGYFKRALNANEKKSALTMIEEYRKNTVPFIVPLMTLKHCMAKTDQPKSYIANQSIWQPFPKELTRYENIT